MEMTNIYRHWFTVKCPNNDQIITYFLELQQTEMIMVEEIVKFCSDFPSCYQEEIANRLHEKFGGYQIIKGHHHGIDVETRRGIDDPLPRNSDHA